ncbi:uncharacterized protein LOC104898818 [Beta vulgaris subsp. vulgaris]|uniref:uncharacterized protein LOC104898818 n=1 Tax=Beta vulgaris subsp. vulgaris TaxID=3555 RepID=UPI00053FE9AD|nr:uncharacterized protein LOC104898818 [Beta vulgaris subsp. vulgaris]
MDNETPKNSSFAFRILFGACRAFKEGLFKRFGNGRSINIDSDRWHPNIHLKPNFPENHASRAQVARVSDLIDHNKRWRPSIIWNLFPAAEAREIFATHIPQHETEDEIGWSHTKSGNFIVKSGYWFLNGEATNLVSNSSFWNQFWKSNIFPKWKHFLWKIFNNALPTTDNLTRRKIKGINVTCRLCNKKSESLEHLFRDCHIVQRIWSCSLGIVASNGINLPIQEWIKNFFELVQKKKKKEEGMSMEIDFVSTLWGIWIHRNEVTFKGMSTNPERIMSIIKEHSLRAGKERRNRKEITGLRDQCLEVEDPRHLEWSIGKEAVDNVKTIVVDGAWKKNVRTNQCQAAIAWKNLNNDPREESATKIFANSAVQTEAYAVLKAISDMEWRSAGLIIKSDNSEVIMALKNKLGTNQNIDNIIRDIRRKANSFLYISCIKVSREEVKLAHNLAISARMS